jgi:hypothetical protein
MSIYGQIAFSLPLVNIVNIILLIVLAILNTHIYIQKRK